MRYRFALLSLLAIFFLNLASPEICDRFAYVQGYQCTSRDISDILAFSAITFLVALFLPINDSAETAIIWLMYVCHLMSISVALPLLGYTSYEAYEYYIICCVLFTIGARVVPLINFRLRPPQISSRAASNGVIAVSGAALTILIMNFPVTFDLPNITDVYGVRDDFSAFTERASYGLLNYLPVLCGYFFAVICLFISVDSFRSRNMIRSGLAFLVAALNSLAVFSLTGVKSVAFVFVVVLILLISLERTRRTTLVFFSGLLGVAGFSAVIAFLGVNDDAFFHWIRRVMLVPGMNAAYFFDMFGLPFYESHTNAPLLVSLAFFGTGGNAVTGLFGSGIAAGGVVGLFLHSLIFFGFLAVLRNVGRTLSPSIAISLTFPVGYAFINTSPFTVLLTYGGLFTIIFLWIWGGAGPSRRRQLRRSTRTVRVA